MRAISTRYSKMVNKFNNNIVLYDHQPWWLGRQIEKDRHRGMITHWRTKGGKLIAIKDMTDTHLKNTIAMLRRQIDGSAHDDFVLDNIIAMEGELKRRKR